MKKLCITLLIWTTTLASPPAVAANFSDPTWPCIQRKVATISLGQMFPHIIPPMPESNAEQIDQIDHLAAKIALRRFDETEIETLIDQFAQTKPSNPAFGLLMQAAFEIITRRRTSIMNGIGRYAAKQTSLSDLIEQRRSEIKALTQQATPDFDKIDAIEAKLDWDERIYHDRVRSLRYVCESPVLLEKRAFAIARLILKYWDIQQ